MRITSYNITDVGYHYIGLRALGGLPPTARREEQTSAISRSVLKYVSDKALRLMLPEPKGTFETVGEKICQELVHFQFAKPVRGGYELTEAGRAVLELLENHRHVELRRIMAKVHLQTYDNLRLVVEKHLELGSIWRPVVNAEQLDGAEYVEKLLEPTFREEAQTKAAVVLANVEHRTPKKLEDALRELVLQRSITEMPTREPLFRSLCDRLVSLRLLNIMRKAMGGCEFAKSYSPCVAQSPPHAWYTLLKVPLSSGESYTIFFSEPDVEDPETRRLLLRAIEEAFSTLSSRAGYYDLPEVRDLVCECLRFPEASFDEGVNRLLDLQPCPLTVGLQYEGISARRKPLVRGRGTTQIYNVIRRA